MIASYAHNYIFIKTGKVAGTSVEMALSRFCGPRDIITPIYPPDEIERKPPARHAQNFSTDPALERRHADLADRGDRAELWKMQHELQAKAIYTNHMAAPDVRERIGESFWHGAFKFTIERHPYERVISTALWWIYDHQGTIDASPEILDRAINVSIDMLTPGTRYRIDGAVAVDRILRYENLGDDLAAIADRIGGDIGRSLPRAKSGIRKPEHSVENLLSGAQKRRIAERHAATFELLGYSTDL